MELITACGYGKLELVDMRHRYMLADMQRSRICIVQIWILSICTYRINLKYFTGMAVMGLNLRFGA
jgi:hypothetical protein